MEVRFADAALDRLEVDAALDGGFPPGVVKTFRKRMQLIRAASDKRDFYAMRGCRFEKLKGARQHQFSMRLNDQFRLVLEFEEEGNTTIAVIASIEDYH